MINPIVLTLILSLLSFTAAAQADFPLGNGMDKWGVPLKVPESDVSLRLGARFQSLATAEKNENLDTNTESTSQDFQARRVRFQLQAEWAKKAIFYMDVRNDNANQDDEGEKNFNVGDAYAQIPLSEGSSHALKLYRAKVDVARTQTVSSSKLLFLNRAYISDEAAQFVSHNRRASNIQLVGNFANKMTYQLVAGDGVYSGKFFDAKGNTVDRVEKQNFMLGGKIRFHPFSGWEDSKFSETYFGQGKHFSFGAGAFNTSNIHIVEGANEETVSRNLFNAEASFHLNQLSVASEYFKLDGVIEDHSAANFNRGTGEGWYIQGEWVFTNYYFLAPFARYEKWNKFLEKGQYDTESNLYGVNWYLNGNRFRVGAAYETRMLGRDIASAKKRVEAFHLTTMWHF